MEQNSNNDYYESRENFIFINKLNEVLVPDLKTFSSWSDFKIKILNNNLTLKSTKDKIHKN